MMVFVDIMGCEEVRCMNVDETVGFQRDELLSGCVVSPRQLLIKYKRLLVKPRLL